MIEWDEIKNKSKKDNNLDTSKIGLLKKFKNAIGSIKNDSYKTDENTVENQGNENQEDLKNSVNSKKIKEEVVMLSADFLEKNLLPEIKNISETNRLEGIFILDIEGLPIISYSSLNIDEDIFAAGSASIISSSQVIASDLGKDNIKRISIETNDGFILFSQIEDYIIAIMAKEDLKLGIIRAAISKVEKLLQNMN